MNWLKDFEWRWSGLTVKETGANVKFTPKIIGDFFGWLGYFYVECLRRLFRSIKTQSFTYHVSPNKVIRPWYLLGIVLLRAQAKNKTRTDQDIDVAILFSDTTVTQRQNPPPARHTLNYDCLDISKSHIAKVYEQIFERSLAINPQTFSGEMVVKSEKNGAHDGHIVMGPCTPNPEWVYQRAIDNTTDDNHVRDLRCVTLKGRIIVLYIKERPIEKRFENLNTRCQLVEPEDFFKPDELEKISQFCQRLRLDWGGLDILRDNTSNEIFVVDVNKTDMGPPLTLPLKDKLTSTTRLAHALNMEFGQHT